jgi:hypothetical protein
VTHTLIDPTGTMVPPSEPARRGWALAGIGAGVAGLVSMVASGLTGAVYEEEIAGDAVAITERLSELVPQILVFHTATMVSALLTVVFAAGLRRQLAHRAGAESLLPSVAFAGLVLVAACQFLGAGLTTEFAFATSEPERIVPENAAFFSHWMGTIPWLWGAAGLTALATAVAAFRYAAYARWIGVVGVVLGGLTALFAISPLQYMAGMTGPLWLTVVATGLAVSRHGRR